MTTTNTTRRPAKTTTGPAMTRIASCYNPDDQPGSGRQIDIRRDNRRGWLVCATLQRGEVLSAKYRYSEDDAYASAASLGYTDIVRTEAA